MLDVLYTADTAAVCRVGSRDGRGRVLAGGCLAKQLAARLWQWLVYNLCHAASALTLILTHENADFDAVAAQLGAWLLDPSAVPVLPRRCNRNVRAFLSIYSDELPFVEVGDLPRRAVDRFCWWIRKA